MCKQRNGSSIPPSWVTMPWGSKGLMILPRVRCTANSYKIFQERGENEREILSTTSFSQISGLEMSNQIVQDLEKGRDYELRNYITNAELLDIFVLVFAA